jgi:putative FmdB family regulatory protein
MPLYEYECQKCGQVFEVIQKFSDAPLESHANCGGPVERLVSAPAFHFKGSGWYVTDYAKKNGSSSAGGENGKNGGSTKSENASSKPAESKTETKSESKPSSSSESAPKS